MKKKNLILLLVWLISILIAVISCFWVYVVRENFQVLAITSCDSTKETCFIVSCESLDTENRGYICGQSDTEKNQSFTYIMKKKSAIPTCDARTEECASLTCESGEDGCERMVCSQESLAHAHVPSGVECSIYVPPAPEPVVVPEPKIEAPAVVEPEPLLVEPQPGIILDEPQPTTTPSPQPAVVLPNTPVTSEPYDPSTDTSL
jgi:hypothetical protein